MSDVVEQPLPPYHEEAEMATLGALLLNFSADLLDEIQQYVKPGDFYKNAHKIIFASLKNLYERGSGIDILTLTDELISTGNLEKASGAAYIASLTSRVPTTANVVTYAKIVKHAYIRRSLLGIAHTMMGNAHDESKDTRLIIEQAEQSIFNLNENQSHGELKPVRDIMPIAMNTIENRAKMRDEYTGVPSGFEELDKLTNGFQNSEMIIIGARPSIGKTALALSMAINIAVKKKKSCGFFTLEMSEISLMTRIISAVGKINSNKLRSGLLSPSDYNKLHDAAGLIYEASLILQDTPNIPLLDLRSLARRMVRRHGVEIIFIDYIGLISPEDNSLPRHEQISHISRSLKALSRELDIPIVALSQVGRQSEGKQPTLADLRESGALEQDADVVLFLHRDRFLDRSDEKYENNSSDADNGVMKTELIVAKQRNGPTDSLKLSFIPHFTRFESFSYDN